MHAGRYTEIRVYTNGFDQGFVKVAGAKTNGLNGTAEPIDITDKQSGKARVFDDDTGTLTYDLNSEGVLKDDLLYKLFRDQEQGTALHNLGFFTPGIGELQAKFFISAFSIGAGQGAEARTFSASFQSSGNAAFKEDT